MNLSRHDELLLKDLRFQPLWLLLAYVLIGLMSFVTGIFLDDGSAKWLCGGGGFLVALGAEKWVSRRVRMAALALLKSRDGEPVPASLHTPAHHSEENVGGAEGPTSRKPEH